MITVNINKAKEIGHSIRREKRAEEFKPFDEIIAKQIPGQISDAEESRQAIREKYADIQKLIDSAKNTDSIKSALGI